MRIVERYDGSDHGINEAVAELLNASVIDERWSYRRIDIDEVESWFRSSWFDPEELALCFVDRRLVGLVWAWQALRSNSVSLSVDPSLPKDLRRRIVEALLAWARLSFERRGVRGSVDIRCGTWFSYLHREIVEVLESPRIEISWGTMMVYRGSGAKHGIPPGYSVRRGELSDLPRIVEVLNAAFSKYEWWYPIEVEELRRRIEKGGMIYYVALDSEGNVVGYVDVRVYEALDGDRTATVGLLAVDPKHQGKGLGKALMSVAVEELLKLGVRRVYLDSVEGLEKLYRKFGFVEHRKWIVIRTFVSALPQAIPCLERWR